MEMKVRGWRKERVVWVLTTTGDRLPLVTGLTTDQDGREVAVLAIGTGPSAILAETGNASTEAQLRVNIASTAADFQDERRSGR